LAQNGAGMLQEGASGRACLRRQGRDGRVRRRV
jgi:hypothetical protein